MSSRSIAFSAWLITGSIVYALAVPALANSQGTTSPEGASDADAVASGRGRQVYTRACIACHGRSGRGDGPAARYLDPRPKDFTSGSYKFRSTPSGSPPTDEDLYRIISSGIPRTYMPPWEDLLSEQERYDVVSYIKTFSNVFERESTPIEISEEPPVTPESITEGKNIYMIMQCWTCHGRRGRGDGNRSDTLVDTWGDKIKAFDFTVGNYKAGKDSWSVFKTFETGLDGTPMPSYSGAFFFGRDAIQDLSVFRQTYSEQDVAFLRSYLGSQPTQAELSGMSEEQRDDLVNRRS